MPVTASATVNTNLAIAARTISPAGTLAIGGTLYNPNFATGSVTLASGADGTAYDLVAYIGDAGTWGLTVNPLGTTPRDAIGFVVVGTAIDYPSKTGCVVLPLAGTPADLAFVRVDDGVQFRPNVLGNDGKVQFYNGTGTNHLDLSVGVGFAILNAATGTLTIEAFSDVQIQSATGFSVLSSGGANIVLTSLATGDLSFANNGSGALAISTAHGALTLSGGGGVAIGTTAGDVTLSPVAGSHVKINGANFDDYLPWRIEVDPLVPADANTGWSQISAAAGILHGGYSISNGAVGAQQTWNNLVLAAGTWTIRLVHHMQNNAGQYRWSIDGVNVGALIEGYLATATPNIQDGQAGIVIATSGRHALRLTMPSKNASSAGFFGLISRIVLVRTA